MNCGLCVEFCPFDAIKMGHEIEVVAFQDRHNAFLWDKQTLLRPVSYHAEIHPTAYAQEQAAKKPADD